MTDEVKWLQWEHKDGDHLSGRSVFGLLQPLIGLVEPRFVVVADLNGAIFGLTEEQVVFPIEDFMSLVSNADQYDWAFFFFL